jgi:hypothetical protein
MEQKYADLMTSAEVIGHLTSTMHQQQQQNE